MNPSPSDPPGDAASFEDLAQRLSMSFDRWASEPEPWPDDLFDGWVRAAFAVQYAGNEAYRRYCDSRDARPGTAGTWRDVPAVPTAAFRAVDLIVGTPSDARLVFRTSGTTRGEKGRGRHLVRSPELYRSCLRAAFRVFVLGGENTAILVTLLPSFTLTPDSSLGWMLEDLRDGLGASGSLSVATPAGIDWDRLARALDRAAEDGLPLCVLGTTVSFAAWRDWLDDTGHAEVELPPGSRLMDTGGTKDRAGLDRNRLMAELAERFGLGPAALVNEFGMTELLSQRYASGARPAPLVGPPWLRTRVVDPISLEELPDGEVGLLSHFDIANLGSVCSVLTEDRGRMVNGGIEWLGRTPGAPPRGCSLATSELLEAQHDA